MTKKIKKPKITIQEEHFDEKTDRVFIHEYDANQKPHIPDKPQIVFEPVYGGGCVAVDWSPEVENVLGVAGIEYTVMNYSKKVKKGK